VAGYRFHFFRGMGGPFLVSFLRAGFVNATVTLDQEPARRITRKCAPERQSLNFHENQSGHSWTAA
jgi:hypothetical protein